MGRDSDENSFTVTPGNASIVGHATLLDFNSAKIIFGKTPEKTTTFLSI